MYKNKFFHFIMAFFISSVVWSCSDDNDDNSNNVNNVNNINNLNNTNNTNNTNNLNNTNNTNNLNNTNNTNDATCIPNPNGYECTNCIDDDGDGMIDGMDPGCISSEDRLEGSFETDIPGDDTNTDIQDCWFDGNSGTGDDGCAVHICCILDECPEEFTNDYVPSECETAITQDCVDNCEPYVVPGCDCFGCCTICEGTDCYDVFIGSPRISPDCDQDSISDPELCPSCTPVTDCGAPCDPDNCILCPGQTIDDLPEHCTDSNCPDNQTTCTVTDECPDTEYCATGCCIPIPNVE
ncbi:MAG: hypothetical protein PF689_05820 [Deltaproteobacteria bacterium]|jgi:hypothetical protein|nr:hypothetical protein [Deltaproteobacteria bacterium]